MLVIGLDGADWAVIDSLISTGDLPTFERLITTGVSAELQSEPPLLSPPLWTTLATGRTPLEHGVTWFLGSSPSGEVIPVSGVHRKRPAFWEIAAQANKRVGLIGWWATWPAEPISGIVVSDQFLPRKLNQASEQEAASDTVYPKDREQEFRDLIPGDGLVPNELRSSLVDDDASTPDVRQRSALLRSAIRSAETHQRIALRLLEDPALQLLAVYFDGIDTASHLFMNAMPPAVTGVTMDISTQFGTTVPDFYRYQDRLLGELFASAGDGASVLIVSDHGFRFQESRLPAPPGGWSLAKAPRDHLSAGILIASGPAFRSVPGRLHGPRIEHVAPLILQALGAPVEVDMDTSAADFLLHADHLAAYPPQKVESFPPRVAPNLPPVATPLEDTKDRLRTLGYLQASNNTNDRIEVEIHRAIHLDLAGKTTEAEVLYERLLGAGDPRPALGLARLLITHQDEQRAAQGERVETLLRQATEHGGPKAEILELRGRALLKSGRSQDAEVALRASLAADPTWSRAREALTDLLLSASRPKEAVSELEILSRHNPRSAATRRNLGVVLEMDGRTQEARAQFENALKIDPQFVPALVSLGLLCERTQDFEAAEQSYRAALRADPRNATATAQLGVLLVNLKQYAQALPFLELGIQIQPQNPVLPQALERARAGIETSNP